MLTHISFGKGQKTLAILIPTKDMDRELLIEYYVKPLEIQGIQRESIVVFNLEQSHNKKTPNTLIKAWLKALQKSIEGLHIENVLVCDSDYFKVLAKVTKADPHYGYPMTNTLWSGNITAFVCLNYRALFFNPAGQKKIDFSLKAVANHMLNKGSVFDVVLKDCSYPSDEAAILRELEVHLPMAEALTCDIEAYSLKVDKAGLASISFGYDKHKQVSFHIGQNQVIRFALKQFFINYTGKLIFHGSPYDCKVLIWELFMDHPRDYAGMLNGLHTMFRNLEDTKILAYLALNTTTILSLKLKDLAFEYTGNYALDDIHDITKIIPDDLLIYNSTDTAATWFIYDMYKPVVLREQNDVYENIFRPALKVITQMELCGMPLNMGQVINTEYELDDIAKLHADAIKNDPIVTEFKSVLRQMEADKANKKLKKLRKEAADFLHLEFNPGSNTQVSALLYKHLSLPVLNTTDTNLPATDSKTLKTLLTRLKVDSKYPKEYAVLVEHIIDLSAVRKILDTFIPAFKNNSILKDGWSYLHGGFNLGGTKSGRLSSSEPNLTNIPSKGTQYAKPIKKAFQAPPPNHGDSGWLMVGADFASLEDRISALLTKDINKLKIYSDGYDGHCLRAYKYFGNKMPDIVETVESINSIETKYPDLRQLSKSPTFLLTYMGTWKGLMRQFGFKEAVAKQIEKNYHELYSVSDDWIKAQIEEAAKCGYATLAFGLRLRTPILPQVVLTSNSIPYQAHKEVKTVGNAHGQSYGLLNTRAGNEFQQRVWDSKWSTSVLPICQIHDSLYYMIRNSLNCLKWVNDNLIECMEWNQLPAIQHPVVKIKANLEVYYPDWSTPIKIPNRIERSDLKELLDNATRKIHEQVLRS